MKLYPSFVIFVIALLCYSTNAIHFLSHKLAPALTSGNKKGSTSFLDNLKSIIFPSTTRLSSSMTASIDEKVKSVRPSVTNTLQQRVMKNKSVVFSTIEASNPIEIEFAINQIKLRGGKLLQNFLDHPKIQQLQKALHVQIDLNKHKKKILILMSDTGGGHRASAQAIEQALHVQYPNKFLVEIMDVWTDHGAWPYNRFVPIYRYLAKHPLLWKGCYAYGTFPVTRKVQELHSWRSCHTAFQQAIEAANPDCVISVHPLCQYIPLFIVQEMNQKRRQAQLPRIPFITVVTDLAGGHKTWFDKRVDACYVPSKAMEELAIQCGLPAEKIVLKGLPIRPAFWLTAKDHTAYGMQQWKEQMRKKLGFASTAKTILLMGGGDGVGNIPAIANHLYTRLSSFPIPSQLVVICGHNTLIRDTLTKQLVAPPSAPPNSSPPAASTSPHRPSNQCQVWIQGFVNNMHEYMLASDCLITKAGPGTIAESMICGLPIILSSYLPGQETGNVPYVVNGGFGVYTGQSPTRITNSVCDWISSDELLAGMSEQAKHLSHPKATISIAKDIGDCMLHGKGTILPQEYMQE